MKTRLGLWLTVIATALAASACDWVDSTGIQGTHVPVTEVFLDDALVEGVMVLAEKTDSRVTVNRDSAAAIEQSYSWGTDPVDQGKLANCASFGGFDAALAADSLAEACTASARCSLDFEPVESDDGITDFSLRVPELKASVGLVYEVTTTDSQGRADTSNVTLCLLAINEAPVANDDTFAVLEGQRTTFRANGVNLLSNDQDDVDVSNTEFRILPEPYVAPLYAAFFELGEDGSFTYESSLTGLLSDTIDNFEYTLTDGVHESHGLATIRIVSSNQAPEQIDQIPLLVATVDEPFLENLALYFIDPEEGALAYSLGSEAALPSDGTLELDSEGLLSGTPDEDDVGTYVLTLVVDDGGQSIESVVTLQVDPAPLVPENSAPEYIEDTVFDQTILLGRSIRPIVPVFIDPDGDALTYAIVGNSDLPKGVEIDEDTGVVSGRPVSRTWVRKLSIEATDPAGATAVSELFYIRVK